LLFRCDENSSNRELNALTVLGLTTELGNLFCVGLHTFSHMANREREIIQFILGMVVRNFQQLLQCIRPFSVTVTVARLNSATAVSSYHPRRILVTRPTCATSSYHVSDFLVTFATTMMLRGNFSREIQPYYRCLRPYQKAVQSVV